MSKVFTKYFARHKVQVEQVGESDLKVVVPVYLEEDTLPIMLNSLMEAKRCCKRSVEVILVFNYPEGAADLIVKRQHDLLEFIQNQYAESNKTGFLLTVLTDFDVPKKHAGVGHARKTGMDYAAYAFYRQNKPDGVIISLDADTTVENNYFEAIYKAYLTNKYNGCTIHFEHPLHGDLDEAVYSAIAEYELHLRYYIQALRYAGFPHAYHTVGSCFSCTAEAYVKAGGMPGKQAGEDFYFLQKVIPQGMFGEVNNTCVYPSARPSERVPFGTGPTINKLLESGDEYRTYNLQAFIDLKEFLDVKDQLFETKDDDFEDFAHQLSGRFRSYLMNLDFIKALKPVKDNCGSLNIFQKRFYEVFNAFRVVKYLNYTHAHFLEKTPVFDAALSLYEKMKHNEPDVFESSELLGYYRQLEKE